MQIKLDIKGLKEIQADLKDFSERRMKAVAATTLTRTAREVEKVFSKSIAHGIDRPVKRTTESVVVKQATASSLVAVVRLKDRLAGLAPAQYMPQHEFAGSRLLKKFEQALVKSGAMPAGYFVVPGRTATLDAHGNVSRAQITHVITQLGADYSPGYQQTISKKTKKRMQTAAKHGRKYVSVHSSEARKFKVSPGIYEMQADGSRKAVFLFKTAVQYRKRLNMVGDGEVKAKEVFDAEFTKALSESKARLAMRSAR